MNRLIESAKSPRLSSIKYSYILQNGTFSINGTSVPNPGYASVSAMALSCGISNAELSIVYKNRAAFYNGARLHGDVALESKFKVDIFVLQDAEPDGSDDTKGNRGVNSEHAISTKLTSESPQSKAKAKVKILYAKDGIFIAYKPRYLPSMPAQDNKHFSFRTTLEEIFGKNVHTPSRLDYVTEGLILGSYSVDTHNYVQEIYAQRNLESLYLFKSQSEETQSDASFKNYYSFYPICRSSQHEVLRWIYPGDAHKIAAPFAGTAVYDKKLRSYQKRQFAATRFTPLFDDIYAAKTYTGRTHQIRVHAAAYGFPLRGDPFYNPGSVSFTLSKAYMKIPGIGVTISHAPDWASDWQWEQIKGIIRL